MATMIDMTSLPPKVEKVIAENSSCEQWLNYARQLGLGQETIQLLQEFGGNDETIKNLFNKRLVFGTAGIRGKMEIGFNRFNVVTVTLTSQALAEYLLNTYGQALCSSRGIMIGFDGRIGSPKFASCTAAAFLQSKFKVYMANKVVPTPFVPFAVKKYKCLAGIMITASHNPKHDNGYKVYAENGAQIISPMDADIMSILSQKHEIDEIVKFLKNDGSCMLLPGNACINPYDELLTSYVDTMTSTLSTKKPDTVKNNPLKIVYTAMHGVGFAVVDVLLDNFGYKRNLFPVENQMHPDGNFPTVSFPNPEEKGAMDESIKYADAIDSPLIIANDPDADRLAVAEKVNGKWLQFSGDQLGVLLMEYRFRKSKEAGMKPSDMLFISTLVSSRMLENIVKVEGGNYRDTLTGFKWIMNLALDLSKEKQLIPVASYEEALGYALSMAVPDKDGISAAAVFVEMACELYAGGSTVKKHLEALYKQYGLFQTMNGYYFCYDPVTIKKIFDEFRNNGAYTWKLGDLAIDTIKDITVGYDSTKADKKLDFPATPETQMICLRLKNGGAVTLRASGTEPKIKYYCELMDNSGNENAASTLEEQLKALVTTLADEFYKPDIYDVRLPS